ncbi:MAG: carbamoyltransferase HypF [Bacteroidales bacterium]|nr:carbamoyltransferase HypF [Bacteroidales bacterium]
MKKAKGTYLIEIKGLVQGVGFRPFIYRLSKQYGLNGWVANTNEGIKVNVHTDPDSLSEFLVSLRREAPPASDIYTIQHKQVTSEEFSGFVIRESQDSSEEITEICPDIAVCEDCLHDMQTQAHRINYPFLNCTNCGPRFTIIHDLPYDRDKTTMAPFTLCTECRAEYENVMDRRFHAQPVACNTCGPAYQLFCRDEKITELEVILKRTSGIINTGGIVAVKGMGGYFLACDAKNESAVSRLRNLKHREGKPFAVMFRDLDSAREFVEITSEELELLNSWRRPVLILKEKRNLATGVSNGLNTIGSMLPYMPFHYLLFEKLDTQVIVLTSGNISDEPIIIDDNAALEVFNPRVDAILSYNREIYNRTDDSVLMMVNEIPRMIRRSRGYVPNPVQIGFDAEGILAAGAELVNCFCLGKAKSAIMSQHIGDLKNYETYAFYQESIERFKKIFRLDPEWVAYDLHPDYLSTQYAKQTGLKGVAVQHHHAHIASAMAEHGLDEQVIGVSFDGTGLGDDGQIWGGEFLVADMSHYQRFTHFDYLPMPGGDKVTSEPWRMALSYLYRAFGKDCLNIGLTFLEQIEESRINTICRMLDKNVNSPNTSSAGRLFDAVSALLNICTHAKFHAEAPMRLENAISPNILARYDVEINDVIDFIPSIRMITDDLKKKVSSGIISAKFHNTVLFVVEKVVSEMKRATGLNKVILSGGTFQNRYLLGNLEKRLSKDGFQVYTQNKIPANDGGIALGQLAIAAKRIALGLI